MGTGVGMGFQGWVLGKLTNGIQLWPPMRQQHENYEPHDNFMGPGGSMWEMPWTWPDCAALGHHTWVTVPASQMRTAERAAWALGTMPPQAVRGLGALTHPHRHVSWI